MRKEIEKILMDGTYAPSGVVNRKTDALVNLFKRIMSEGEPSLTDHEKLRREHWSRAYCCVVPNEENSHDFCKITADVALKAFDNKFK